MAAGTKEGDSLLDDRKCRSISNGLVACSMDPKQMLALLCPPRIQPTRVRDDVAAKLSTVLCEHYGGKWPFWLSAR